MGDNMGEMEENEIKIVENALINISKELNDDAIDNIEFFCGRLKENLSDILVGMSACTKIEKLNKEVRKSQQETIEMYKSILEYMQELIERYNL